MRHALGVTALAALLLASPVRAADSSNAYLVQAKVFYQGLEFEKCLKRLDQASRWQDNQKSDLTEIELFHGLCLFSLGKRQDAKEHFVLALQLDPYASLPPTASPRIVRVFEELAQKARAAHPRAEAPPPSDRPVEAKPDLTPAPPPPTTLELAQSAPPPHHKSFVAPITLSAVAVASAAAGGVLGYLAQRDAAAHNSPDTYGTDAPALGKRAQGEALGANVAYGVAGAAAIAAVVLFLTAK